MNELLRSDTNFSASVMKDAFPQAAADARKENINENVSNKSPPMQQVQAETLTFISFDIIASECFRRSYRRTRK